MHIGFYFFCGMEIRLSLFVKSGIIIKKLDFPIELFMSLNFSVQLIEFQSALSFIRGLIKAFFPLSTFPAPALNSFSEST